MRDIHKEVDFQLKALMIDAGVNPEIWEVKEAGSGTILLAREVINKETGEKIYLAYEMDPLQEWEQDFIDLMAKRAFKVIRDVVLPWRSKAISDLIQEMIDYKNAQATD